MAAPLPTDWWPTSHSEVSDRVSGHLSSFLPQRTAIGALESVLATIHGLTLEFSILPPLSHASHACDFAGGLSLAKCRSLAGVVWTLLSEQVIKRAPWAEGFHVLVFLVSEEEWEDATCIQYETAQQIHCCSRVQDDN